MEPIKSLITARKNYSSCAKSVEANLAVPGQPSAIESERLIAFGIAADWVQRAACLQPLVYSGHLLNRSNRAVGVTELTRFNFSWAGMNALFARKAVLDLLGTPLQNGEFERFKLLYTNSGVLGAKSSSYETILHGVLDTRVVTRIAGLPAGTPVTTLHSLHFKYTPHEAQSRGVGKKIATALSTGNIATLDLPLIIYAARNWSVHGGAIDSSFRGVPKFRTFINTINEALAEIHVGVATKLNSLV